MNFYSADYAASCIPWFQCRQSFILRDQADSLYDYASGLEIHFIVLRNGLSPFYDNSDKISFSSYGFNCLPIFIFWGSIYGFYRTAVIMEKHKRAANHGAPFQY